MSEGYIRIHRKIMESSVWEKPHIFMIWSWCLLKANHTETKFPFNGEDLVLKAGQFITGRERALDELNGYKKLQHITAQMYRNGVDYLKSTNRITIKTTNRFSIISIVNWKEYQSESTSRTTNKSTNKEPTGNQLGTTYNNDKNDKKDINIAKVLVSLYGKKITEIKGASYKPMISWGRLVKRLNELLEDFTFEEIMEMVNYYFDSSKKGDMFGYELLTILSNHSVNQWQDYAKAK